MKQLATLALCIAAVAHGTAGAEASSFGLPDADRIAVFHAEGAQVYECRPDAGNELTWRLKEPVASLFDQAKQVGRHYAGPSWEFADGTVVRGKVVAKSPPASQGAIPHLMLTVTSSIGEAVSQAHFILRINTQGGVAPPTCAEAGKILSVPYSADYAFYIARSQD